MKKLLTLSFVALFVAMSTLSFAQDAPAADAQMAAEQPQVVSADDNCCGGNGGFVSGGYVSGGYAGNCAPCYDNCAPSYGCDPCGGYGYGCGPCGYGYRTPVRNFLGRLFAPRAYYGCAPCGYGYGCGPAYGYGYGGCAPAYGCGPCGYGGGYGYGGCCY